MNRLLIATLLAGSFLTVPGLAFAQAKAGDKEIQIAGNTFTIVSGGTSSTTGQFQFGLGYFVTDRMEIGFSPIVTVSTTPGVDPKTREKTTDVTGDLGLSTKVQFFFGEKSATVKPYVGGTFIVQSFKTQDTGSLADNTFVGGNLGLKNYFTEKAALDMNVSIGFRPSAPSDFQLIQFNIGITYVF